MRLCHNFLLVMRKSELRKYEICRQSMSPTTAQWWASVRIEDYGWKESRLMRLLALIIRSRGHLVWESGTYPILLRELMYQATVNTQAPEVQP